MPDLYNLKRKVQQYKEVLQNTENYRKEWKEGFRDFIIQQLNHLVKETGLEATIGVQSNVENMEAVVLSLGDVQSGLYSQVGTIERHLIKHNGSLVYQQLFNGKIIVLIQYPAIENYGEPRPPKNIAIYRPEELTAPYFIRHMEDFIREITNWEDYDDDEPNKRIGFKFNFEQQEK